MLAPPHPRVAIPQGWQEVDASLVRPTVGHGDPDQDILGARLGILAEDVPVPALIEDAGVFQLELELVDASSPVLFHQSAIRIFHLGVLVQGLHVGVCGGGV